jgi:hypothetical protein
VLCLLVADTRKLLSHTHFAVCTKAIQVLSMLAEGIGEKLYPSLRPALTPLLQLSKDKRLAGAVSSGLDALLGNFLSIESLMDNDDAIPSSVDKKTAEERSGSSDCYRISSAVLGAKRRRRPQRKADIQEY